MAPISIPEKLALIAYRPRLFLYLLYIAIRTRSCRDIRIARSRYFVRVLSVSQIQYLVPPSGSAYREFTRSAPVVADITEIAGDAPARLMWLGQYRPGKKVLLYFHGGGYIIPLTQEHLMYCEYMRGIVGREELVVAVLEYESSPDKRYPYQLAQASAALAHLLASGVSPEDIAIGGDSAGGHLALGLISHILHPHPQIRAIPTLSSPFAALLLLSPVTTFRVIAESFTRNNSIDCIDKATCEYWNAQLTGGDSPYWTDFENGGFWGEAVKAPPGWWKGVGGVVRRCLLTAGDREVLLDDILEFGDALQRLPEDWSVQSIIGRDEVHDAALMDYMMEKKPWSETTIKSANWLKETLGIKPKPC